MNDERDRLEKKLNELREKYDKLTEELYKVQEEIEKTIDDLHSLDDSMVRIICPQCLGLSFKKDEHGRKKHVCDLCRGRGWVWAKRWVGI